MLKTLFFLLLSSPVYLFAQDSLYYTNQAVSVVTSKWENNRRTISLFDLNGNKTYSLEEVRLSYQVSVNLSYYKNGAVKQVIIHTNPGASRYQYQTQIDFSSTNQPIRKTEKRLPENIESISTNDFYLWSQHQKKWIKQESVECQETTTN